MGTRGFTGVAVDKQLKLAYQQFDSYPDGVGIATLRWLREAVKEPEGLLHMAKELRVLTPEEIEAGPQPEDFEKYAEFWDKGVSTGKDWYSLLRHTQGEIAEILRAGVIQSETDFPMDSLFCEWGYLINLEGLTFEVYEGFQKDPVETGLWKGLGPDNNGYYPVALKCAWPLNALPTDEDFLTVANAEKVESGH